MICKKCHQDKPETEYRIKSLSTGKREAQCKECRSAQQKVSRDHWSGGEYRENFDPLWMKLNRLMHPGERQ